MGIVLSAMGDKFIAAANQFDIPLEVMHRIVSMASGGMDTLPHNGSYHYYSYSNWVNT